MNREIGVRLATPIGYGRADKRFVVQQLFDPRIGRFILLLRTGKSPEVERDQALPRKPVEPRLRQQRSGSGRLASGRVVERSQESPTDKFRVSFKAHAISAQVVPRMARRGVERRQMMVAQQRGQMRAASVALRCVAQHHDMRDRQRRCHRLRRAGVDFVVERGSLRVIDHDFVFGELR